MSVENQASAAAVRVGDVEAGCGGSVQAAVVSPVEADPGTTFSGYLVQDKGGPVEPFVVVDAEGITALTYGAPATALCGGKKRAATEDMVTKGVSMPMIDPPQRIRQIGL